MSDRLFDPSSLMSDNIEANATVRTPNPIGETFGQITEMKIVDGKAGPAAKNPGAPWARLDCTLEVTDPEYLAKVGDGTRDKCIMFLGIMLDLQDGKIATGADRNVKLGRLREACGVNGQPLNALLGQFIRVSVGHKPNPKDPEGGPLAEITSYTKY